VPKFKDAPQVYETVDLFVNRCLMQDGSLLWDSPGIWTAGHLTQLHEHFVDDAPGGVSTRSGISSGTSSAGLPQRVP